MRNFQPETLNLQLSTSNLRTSLEEVMREISRSAQQRGLTPEILRSLLDER